MKLVIELVNPEGKLEIIKLPVSNEEFELLKRKPIEERMELVKVLAWRYGILKAEGSYPVERIAVEGVKDG